MRILICTFGSIFSYPCRLFHSLLSKDEEVHSVFFNEHWNNETERFIGEKLVDFKPDLIVISLLTFEFENNKKFIELIRSLLSETKTKIILGGPHAYLDPDSCLNIGDFVCTGEGEFTLLELCKQFRLNNGWENIYLENVPNLYYHDFNGIKKSNIQDFYYSRDKIDDLPFPTYGSSNIFIFNGEFWVEDYKFILTLTSYNCFTSRGCPFQCTYCINSTFSKRKVTLRAPQKVIEEIQLIKQKMPKLNHISFVDEVFGFNDEWVDKFSDLYLKEIRIPFECDTFPGRQSKKTIEKLSKTGLIKVNIGIQTCSKKILKDIYNRPQKSEDILRDDKIYHDNCIMPTYDFIIDNPYETPQDLLETISIVKQFQRPTFFRIYSLYFFPFYPLTIKAENDGICDTDSYNYNFYHKITTNHKGDQYSNQSWYISPQITIKNADPKAALNWILTFYGDPYIPKFLINYALKKYQKNSINLIIFLALYYRSLDKLFRLIFLGQSLITLIKLHGMKKTIYIVKRKFFGRD